MHVFVSHASTDSDVANAYVAALEKQGLTAWIAPRDLRPGTDYAQSISSAIRDASTFLLLCSAAALASPDVRNEFELAKRRGTRVIPIRLPGAPDPLDDAAWEYHLLRIQIVPGEDPQKTVGRILPALTTSPGLISPPSERPETGRALGGAATELATGDAAARSRLEDVWDKATRTVSKILGNEKLLPRQNGPDGRGFRWFYLAAVDGPYASVEFIPANLGTEHSPLWFVVSEETPNYHQVANNLRASSYGDRVKQTHNGIRIPLSYRHDGATDTAIDQVVDAVVELARLGIP